MSKIDIKDLDRWFGIIHNDLYQLHCDTQKPNNQKLRKELTGLRDSILYNACSGINYLYEGNLYDSVDEIEIEDEEDLQEIVKVMNVDYLLKFLEQILRR